MPRLTVARLRSPRVLLFGSAVASVVAAGASVLAGNPGTAAWSGGAAVLCLLAGLFARAR